MLSIHSKSLCVYNYTLYFLSSPPDIISPPVIFQSTARMIPSCAFHWLGFVEGWSGLMMRDLPLAYKTWLLSGDHEAAYTGIANGWINK